MSFINSKYYPYFASMLAVLVQILSIPLLASMYSLDEFAKYTWQIALSALIAGVFIFRLELRLLAGPKKHNLSSLLFLFFPNFLFLSLIVLTFFSPEYYSLIFLIPLFSLLNIFLHALIRDGRYSEQQFITFFQYTIFLFLASISIDKSASILIKSNIIALILVNLYFIIRYFKELFDLSKIKFSLIAMLSKEYNFIWKNILLFSTNKSSVNWLPLLVDALAGQAWMVFFNFTNRGFRQLSNIVSNVSAAKFFRDSQINITSAIEEISFQYISKFFAIVFYIILFFSASDIVLLIFPKDWEPLSLILSAGLVAAYCQYSWSIISSLSITTKRETTESALNVIQIFCLISLIFVKDNLDSYIITSLVFIIISMFNFIRYFIFIGLKNLTMLVMFLLILIEVSKITILIFNS